MTASTTTIVQPTRERSYSQSTFDINETEASSILSKTLRENDVYLSGSSVGKGLLTSAKHYIEREQTEDSFYVVDIGMVVSQVYHWRKCFPRVEPFYAVKCNPDPVIVKTLALMGTNFDCASRGEINLVLKICEGLPRKPEILFANPCKAINHLKEAVRLGVRLVTFDNASEVAKCARISKDLQLILRIATDDRGSQCRLSSKFGAHEYQWRPLLKLAKQYGLAVVGVSFHVGSGCRDAHRYEMALQDARKIFDMARHDFGYEMTILDIGGGFPGETHSMWNPESLDSDNEDNSSHGNDDEDDDPQEGVAVMSDDGAKDSEAETNNHFMFFSEIAEQVAPAIDRLFPAESGVRIIGEPGRYFVAACATLCCSVISCRINEIDAQFEPTSVPDRESALTLNDMSREEEHNLVHRCTASTKRSFQADDLLLDTIAEEMADYSKLFARQNLVQQEVDTYNDSIHLFREGFRTASDLLGPPDESQQDDQIHTVEGMQYPLVVVEENEIVNENNLSLLTLAAAGEAAVSGVVMQAMADSAPLQDDYAYYINDGVYGAFNNIMFDHANVRPRVLKVQQPLYDDNEVREEKKGNEDRSLFPSTVFGPTCDSIDVVARSVLLPKLQVGDWLFFQNMGAYTMAASSSFNGFNPSSNFYVCSVQPAFLEALLAGPSEEECKEE